MAKYDLSFKVAVVRAYLAREGGYRSIANKFGIPAKITVKGGVNLIKNLVNLV